MNISQYLQDDLILIVPNTIKDNVIKEISKDNNLYTYKIFSDSDLKKSLFFDYDINAVAYVSNKCNVDPSIAKEYVENSIYLDDKDYQNDKLNQLVQIKKELDEKGLLIKDEKIHLILNNKKIIVYGFDHMSKELKLILNKMNLPYEVILNEYPNRKINSIYKFDTLENEVNALAIQISSLLQKGVDINKIKLANVSDEYYFTLDRYFKMYNIPVMIPNNQSLSSLLCVKYFIEKCGEYKSLQEALNDFINKYPNEIEIYNQLLKVCNNCVALDLNTQLNSLIYSIKNTKMKQPKLYNAIELISLNNYYLQDDEYIFVVSINQGSYPKSFKDEDFLSDKEKEIIGLDTSDDKNEQSKKDFSLLLNKSEHIVLSYKEKTPFSSCKPSYSIIDEKLEVKEFVNNYEISYSTKANELKLASDYDKTYQKVEDERVLTFAHNYNLPYKIYSHNFKFNNIDKIRNYISKNGINMSYSSLSDYYQCGYKYFLDKILKVSKNETNRFATIGNVFHKTLEDSYSEEFDFSSCYDKHSVEENKENDVITEFYLIKFKDTLEEIIQINKKNIENSALNKVVREKEVHVYYNDPFEIKFKGFIDKIMYQEDNGVTYVAVIDYKTSTPELDVEKVKYGLSMQLPIYIYLIKHAEEFKNVEVCGFYLQELIPEILKFGEDKHEQLEKNIMFKGYSNSSISTLSRLDPGYRNSTMIKSLKRNKDDTQFDRYSKVLSSEEINNLSELVENKVKEAIQGIYDGKFDINPKTLNGKNQSCMYCEFLECCYKDYADLVNLDGVDAEEEDEDE